MDEKKFMQDMFKNVGIIVPADLTQHELVVLAATCAVIAELNTEQVEEFITKVKEGRK